jgi:hypothetical protein
MLLSPNSASTSLKQFKQALGTYCPHTYTVLYLQYASSQAMNGRLMSSPRNKSRAFHTLDSVAE